MSLLSLSGGAITAIIVCSVAAFIALVYVVWYFTTKNGLISSRNDVEEAYSTMDVQMKKRYDLIPNLVDTCKGYVKHEQETLERITRARAEAMAAAPADKPAAEQELASSLHTLLNAVHESYPELKADTQFNKLSDELSQLEEEIARSRKFYNAKIKALNNKIEKFPSCYVAKKMGLERRPYFELEDVAERATPKVSF